MQGVASPAERLAGIRERTIAIAAAPRWALVLQALEPDGSAGTECVSVLVAGRAHGNEIAQCVRPAGRSPMGLPVAGDEAPRAPASGAVVAAHPHCAFTAAARPLVEFSLDGFRYGHLDPPSCSERSRPVAAQL
jgi:hypothetical protein